MFELYATPTPHMPLLALPDDAPAHRVPWLQDTREYVEIMVTKDGARKRRSMHERAHTMLVSACLGKYGISRVLEKDWQSRLTYSNYRKFADLDRVQCHLDHLDRN